METCKICDSDSVSVTYHGPIRIGQGAKRTAKDYDMYRCEACGTMWHENDVFEPESYYESTRYRVELEGTADIANYYAKHDRECFDKFRYTGTAVFRNKVVADVGCGGGSWLDFLKGVARTTIAIEPSETYRGALAAKGHIVYPYTRSAIADFGSKVDLITSWDVIEHVADPRDFVNGMFELLKNAGGEA